MLSTIALAGLIFQSSSPITLQPASKYEYQFAEMQLVMQGENIIRGQRAEGTMTSTFRKQGATWIEERNRVAIAEFQHRNGEWLPIPRIFGPGESNSYSLTTISYPTGLAKPTYRNKYRTDAQPSSTPWWASLEVQHIPANTRLTQGAKWSIAVPAAEIQAFHQKQIEGSGARASITTPATVNFEVKRFFENNTLALVSQKMEYTFNIQAQGQTLRNKVTWSFDGIWTIKTGTLMEWNAAMMVESPGSVLGHQKSASLKRP